MGKINFLNNDNIHKIVEITAKVILERKIVILPTDTIYGFSALVECEDSVRELKKRDGKPFIYLISQKKELDYFNIDYLKYDEILSKNWPGPITFLMNNKFNQKTGVRLTNNKFINALIDKVGLPLISTSVNYSNEKPIEDISKITEEFEELVNLIVVDEGYKPGLSSTIVDISTQDYKIIREGEAKFVC